MGCCFSKKKSSENPHSPELPQNRNFPAEIPAWRSDPHLNIPLEEETVKEVLSETPKPKIEEEEEENKKNQHEEKTTIVEKKNHEEEKTIINGDREEILEEVSEIYSVSESVSVSTTTEKREEENEVDQVSSGKVMKIPACGSVPGRKRERDREEIRRRISPSPVRRRDPVTNGSPVKPVGKISPVKNVGQIDRRKQGVQSAGKRVSGDVRNNGRRSRSPVTRAGAGGPRSLSSGRGLSPCRNPVEEAPEDERKVVDEKQVAESSSESLENPLVSLECFIFL